MEQRKNIMCPNCDTEYLPGEIFIPKYLVGEPKEVERDITGKVIYNEGIDPIYTEEFVCEKCGKKFKVTANLSFTTSFDKLKDTDVDYVSEKYSDRIFLKED